MEGKAMNYILKHEDAVKHYFYLPNEGLCVRTKRLNLWQNRKTIYRDSKDVFSAFCDSSGIIHLICTNSQNEIIYLIYKNNEWQNFTITRLNENMKVLDMKLSKTRIGLNLLYTVQFGGKTLLVHCVLGNNAMPNNLDNISSPDFFIFKERVYYVNLGGVLGYRDFSDGRPDHFNKLVTGGSMPYLLNSGEKDMFVYKKDRKIYFQNRPVHEEENAQNPILLESENQLLLMWQNSDFVRYISSIDEGKNWSSVVQFVNPGRKSDIYYAIHDEETFYYFGNHSAKDLNLYGETDIFKKKTKKASSPALQNPIPSSQITKLKILLEMQKQEIKELKKEINHLSSFIKSLTGDVCKTSIKNDVPKSDSTISDSLNSNKT